jgi:hypothetical protein
MSYDNLSSVSQIVLKFYQQLTGEERRIPFIFDDFHFCRSRVIGLDMTENRIFTLHVCRMITWVVFLRMFWNFITDNISSLPVKRGGSLSFLVGTIIKIHLLSKLSIIFKEWRVIVLCTFKVPQGANNLILCTLDTIHRLFLFQD